MLEILLPRLTLQWTNTWINTWLCGVVFDIAATLDLKSKVTTAAKVAWPAT